MATPPSREVIADYTEFDFQALWKGREKVTQVERAILTAALGAGPEARTLEVGTGFGRLTPVIRAASNQYVGVDFDPNALGKARATVFGDRDASTRWVLANLHHLPFRPGSFSAVVMVRVAHHVPRWEEVASKLAVLLRPGGRCLVTVTPSPTVGTLAEDVKSAMRGDGHRTVSTFARGEDVRVRDSPHPIYVGSRRGYRRGMERAGLRIVQAWGSGLEDIVPGIPARAWTLLARRGEPSPLFPMKWYAAERPGPNDAALPALDDILACPRCGGPLVSIALSWESPRTCPQCRFEVRPDNGFADLRYLSNGTVRVGPAVTRR